MQTAGSGPDSRSTAILATLSVTASGRPGNLGSRQPCGLMWDISDRKVGDMASETESPIPGATIHEDTIVPACEPWSARIQKGGRLRLIDGLRPAPLPP